ncbi:MAG: hypothetical protein ACYSX1_01260 [Planctomycetota bacterium]
MSVVTVEIEDKVDELLRVLDMDIQHIQENLSRLNELRSLVIKRNEADLKKLLENIKAESDGCRKHELKRTRLRKELANALNCNLEDMTLSKLETVLPGEKRIEVAAKKAELKALAGRLKKEHLGTTMLLSDCARFNRQILKCIFDLGKMGIVYYDSKGSTKRGMTEAFVNMQF